MRPDPIPTLDTDDDHDDRASESIPLIHAAFVNGVRQHTDGSATITLSRPYLNGVTNRRRLSVRIPADLHEAWDDTLLPGIAVEIAFDRWYRVVDMQDIDEDYVPAA